MTYTSLPVLSKYYIYIYMQYSTVQYSTVQYNTLHVSIVLFSICTSGNKLFDFVPSWYCVVICVYIYCCPGGDRWQGDSDASNAQQPFLSDMSLPDHSNCREVSQHIYTFGVINFRTSCLCDQCLSTSMHWMVAVLWLSNVCSSISGIFVSILVADKPAEMFWQEYHSYVHGNYYRFAGAKNTLCLCRSNSSSQWI